MRTAVKLLRRFPLQRHGLLSRSGCSATPCLATSATVHSSASLSTSASAAEREARRIPEVSNATTSSAQDLHDALFTLLRERLCSPTRPLPARNIYDELANRTRLVEEFHFTNTNRRLAHQRLALGFLRRYNVLLHSLLFFAEGTKTWNTTAEFHRLALLGESILMVEVRARVLRLFPDIPYSVLLQLLPAVSGEAALCSAFDLFDMKAIVGAKPKDKHRRSAFTAKQKSHMFCAVVGEMYWFAARTRPTDRTHNNAVFPPSDVLILNVLCSHLLECIPAEMIYRVVEPIVADMRRVWVNAPMSLPSQLRLTPRTIGIHSLNSVPLPRPPAEADVTAAAKASEAQSARQPLRSTPETKFLMSFMRPACNHRIFDLPRYQVLASDEAVERCVLSPARQSPSPPAGASFGSEPAHIARAMELARLAVAK